MKKNGLKITHTRITNHTICYYTM